MPPSYPEWPSSVQRSWSRAAPPSAGPLAGPPLRASRRSRCLPGGSCRSSQAGPGWCGGDAPAQRGGQRPGLDAGHSDGGGHGGVGAVHVRFNKPFFDPFGSTIGSSNPSSDPVGRPFRLPAARTVDGAATAPGRHGRLRSHRRPQGNRSAAGASRVGRARGCVLAYLRGGHVAASRRCRSRCGSCGGRIAPGPGAVQHATRCDLGSRGPALQLDAAQDARMVGRSSGDPRPAQDGRAGARRALLAALGFFANTLFELELPLLVIVAVALARGLLGWWVPDSILKTEAAKERVLFQQVRVGAGSLAHNRERPRPHPSLVRSVSRNQLGGGVPGL